MVTGGDSGKMEGAGRVAPVPLHNKNQLRRSRSMSTGNSTNSRLTVIREIGRDHRSRMIVLCRCSCGNEKEARLDSVRQGRIRSCGCLQKETQVANGKANRTHGQSGYSGHKGASPEWRAWRAMVQRCYDPGKSNYPYYGGRGIKVADRWLGKEGFVSFFADMGEKPSPKHTIDRVNPDGDYGPDNCRWATMKEQGRNTRKNRVLTFNGKTQCVSAWEEDLGFPEGVVKHRILDGWSIERALTQPPRVNSRTRKCESSAPQNTPREVPPTGN